MRNIIESMVTVTGFVQMVFGIVLVSTSWYSHTQKHLYVLLALASARILRLLQIMIRGFWSNILNMICSQFYNAFDLAIGFIVANEEVAKSAHKIIEYEEFAADAQSVSENNIYKMLCFVDQIEEKHPNVACAWRTHRAAIYILRNMKEFIREMTDVYMIDETDAEYLLGEIELKMSETFSQPRYMKAEEGIQNTLRNVQWIKNNETLMEIKKNYSLKKYSKNEVIQDIGEMHTEVKILHKGILKISGNIGSEKQNILPNSDTLTYFCSKGRFLTYIDSPHSLGLLGYLLKTPSVTRVDSQTDSELISISFEAISEIEEQLGSLSFYMWRPVALQISFDVLRDEQIYENWSDEKLKIHLEEGIFPNLEGKVDFDVHSVVADMILIQGRVRNKSTGTVYVGPAYIPHTVRSLQILDDTESRLRVVMVLLREEFIHACSAMGWLEEDEIKDIGLCLVHRIKRMSVISKEQMNENFGHPKSIIQTLGRLLKPKSERILESESF